MKRNFDRDIALLVSIACGKVEADMYLKNGRIVNVHTGEILRGIGVAIGGNRIAYVGLNTNMIGPATRVIDCENCFVTPAYVDAHCHMDYLYNPCAFVKHVLSMGTTTVLSELTECGVLSKKGLDYLLGATENLPVKCYYSLPSTLPPFPEIEGIDFFDLTVMEQYRIHPRILSLGEITSWPRVTDLDHKIMEKIHFANSNGLLIEGHLTGCKNHEINAMIAAGITSCHESITAPEAKEKLELGLYVMLRHGSVRSDMKELSLLVTENPKINISRIILTLDWMSPEDMVAHGYMNYLIKSAIETGIDPVQAIQMTTINPATYLGLDRDVGSVAPGRRADILIVDNIENGMPVRVIAEGRLAAQYGKLCEEPALSEFNGRVLRLGNWPTKKYTDDDFEIFAPPGSSGVIEFPVIKVINKAVTKRMDIRVMVEGGRIHPELKDGITRLSIIRPDGSVATGLVYGFGDNIGGLATSLGVYNNKLIIIGGNKKDMADATNRMLGLGGGIVLVKDGRLISEIPLPIAGIQSGDDVDRMAGKMIRMKKELRALGCFLEDPFYTIHFLTMSGLPYLRILPNGILDVVKKQIVFPL
ncbi:putative Adenine deaminase [uncultured Desulfobacterium sp.]|uniref:adenine deaminase n=1 Tax=uncultured Desulfobacterium sp. TaxID=201089 RepID=A0A445N0A6_9BACT|nr:putative Adenine deaminase [uncultured Desulfobacterium sp.]